MKRIKVEIEIVVNTDRQHELLSSGVSTMILMLRRMKEYCVDVQMSEHIEGLSSPFKEPSK